MRGYYWHEGRKAQDEADEAEAQHEIDEAVRELVIVTVQEDMFTLDDAILLSLDLA